MNVAAIVFVVVVVLVGGVVAALGDAIGRNLGKKRLRFGRLRPKHTAILGTFLAGMAGTGLTVGLLATLSEPVRAWIVEGEKIRVELGALKGQLGEAQATVKTTQSQLGSVKGELKDQTKKLEDEKTNVKNAQAEAADFKTKAASFKASVDAVRKSLAGVQANLKTTADSLKSVREEIARAKVEQTRITGENTSIQSKNLALTQENTRLEGDLAKLQEQVPTLTAKVTELEQAKALLDKTYNARLAQNQSDLKRVREEYDNAARELKNAREDLESVRTQIQSLGNAQVNARRSQLIYNSGDELARIVLPERSNEAEARAALLAALRAAESDAKSKGAAPVLQGTATAGFIEIERSGTKISVADQERQIVQQLAGRREPMVLVLTSALNSFQGEFVWVVPSVRPDPVVFQANEIVAEGQVDGRQSEAEIAQQVLAIVNTKVRQVALSKGMIPATGREMPLGQVTIDQILAIVSQVRSSEKTVRVQFLAAQTTRAAEPLRLVHRLRL
ncbi:MAG: DUF3084 domain-containing protein [Armatimonadetes bacterium]|nr:DUF3084 domain-containing protein [Armatimonadota bacterium]